MDNPFDQQSLAVRALTGRGRFLFRTWRRIGNALHSARSVATPRRLLGLLGLCQLALGAAGIWRSPVLGIFVVNLGGAYGYLIAGAVTLLALRRGQNLTRQVSRLLGVVYAALAIIGFIVPTDLVLGFIQVNTADTVLHAALAALLLWLGRKQST